MSSFSTSLSAQDIWKWTFTKEATAPCVIRDVLSMKQSNAKDTDFYWLGHIPCRTESRTTRNGTLYTIDDSTAVIECVLRHPSPPKSSMSADASRLVQKSGWDGMSRGFNRSMPPPPPPTPVTAIGYPVQVIGKVVRFYDVRQIIAESIEPCQSTNDQWKHWKTVVELHKSKYSVPKPFEIPMPLVSVEILATTSKPAPSLNRQNYMLTSKTNIPAPRTPVKRPLQAHAPSSPLTDSTTSAPSSPVKPGSTVTSDDPFSTPIKRPRVQFDQTPKARTGYVAQDRTPRVSTLDDSAPSGPTGFTLSHLRRLVRIVHAEMKRRARAERETEKAKAAQTQKASSKPAHVPSSNPTHAHSQTRIKPSDAPRVKMKRLFSWAVLKLYEEGSIVLWDRSLRLLPGALSVLLSPGFGDTDNLWKTANSTTSFSTANNSVFSTANSTMFSTTGASSSKFVMSEEDAYLSDPPMDEEDETYISVTPALLAGPIREIMRAKRIGGKSTKVRAEEIARYLRRGDARWARVGAWAVEEAMEVVLGDRN
ncbi:uncharacterized protein EDB91DRAFT_1142931 [Suillus paluster]|uniref:uncharacterized protein n=1 Tax=Suillus paluster TaxID=48578 RepID=UPI001B85FAD8|nr:uncharacterized protein EDB91DRAFT_1142931 [Suillus paluster]KAG1736119.1 hypothetical protein EDB91DRAFT_1142931 [Suillus paluster]